MDEFKSFTTKISRKTVYLSLLAFVVVATIAGLALAPTFNGTATVSAQKQRSEAVYDKDLMAAAVDMRSAGLYSVYAERGSSADNVKGESFDGRAEGFSNVKSDLKASMNYINHLPCTEVSGDLTGRTFAPGIYCVDSGRLAGELTFNAGGDASAMFIVRVKGGLSVADNSAITLTDGAASGNVYVVADNGARVGESVDFKAHLIANGDVNVGAGTKISGRTVSVAGAVVTGRGAELSAEAGTLEICKDVVFPNNTAGAEADTFTNRIFTFTVAGVTVTVPAGTCSAPFSVPSGVQTIQEANTGTFTNMTGTFTGGFQLTNAFVESNLSNSSLIGVNRPLRQVIVNIADPGSLLIVHVVNRPAVTAVIELCKAAAAGDPDISAGSSGAIFQFTVAGVFNPAPSGTPGTNTLMVFRAPLGGCTGPITVEVPSTFPFPTSVVIRTSELGPALAAASGVAGAPTGYELISAEVSSLLGAPAGPLFFDARLNADGSITLGANEGGGVRDFLSAVTSPLDPTNASQETRVLFTNRSLPGIVKVCKIAGPGIPLNTPFVFEVRGNIQTPNPAPSGTIDVFAPNSIRFVEVLAGPAAQGGNCQIVRDPSGLTSQFQIGTPVVARELGALPTGAAFVPNPVVEPATVEQLLDANGVLRDIRISRIRNFRLGTNGAVTPGDFLIAGTYQGVNVSPNPDITPNTALATSNDAGSVGSIDLGRAAVNARREEVTLEFVDVLVQPTELKICKIAGNGIAQGTTANFTVTINNVGGLIPSFTTAVTATAGPGDQGGFCTVVTGNTANGTGTGLIGGSFNVGNIITIDEPAATNPGTVNPIITSSTTPITVTGRTLTTNPALVAGTNVFTFTNVAGTPRAEAVRFDFDGDGKSDASIFTPSTSRWTYAKSTESGTGTFTFGRSTDILTPADYDGDGVYDRAVFRPETGQWFWLGTARNEYRITNWGQTGDIPMAGDFDADGQADYVVFRPSTGTWYMNRSKDGFAVFQFGVTTDKPLVADFDGDNRMDAAVFRPSTGQWFIAGTKDGFAVYNFGVSTDKPVAADYDGDGKADVAVFRNAGGVGRWFILGSAGNYKVLDFGNGTDTPVPADYDGDGKTDLAVFRASEGKWYIRRSSLTDASDMSTISLGDSSDVALPSL